MKTIIGIMLVGLLGFLGCSGSDDGTSAVTGEAIPVAPFGITDSTTPTYKWTPASGATRYRLIVQDTNQESTTHDIQETSIIDEWYTAEEAGCASEDGLCAVTPEIEVVGEHEFKALACANQECGLWSEPLPFDSTVMPEARFIDHGDGTVTDKKTMLMWAQNAGGTAGAMDWEQAKRYSEALKLAGHGDWRLPAIHELVSLIDFTQHDPALPPGNPFDLGGENLNRWSSLSYPTQDSLYAVTVVLA